MSSARGASQRSPMAKLQSLKPALSRLAPRLAYSTAIGEGERRVLPPAPWKAWYKLPRWRALRLETFVRDRFICQMCGANHASPALRLYFARHPDDLSEIRRPEWKAVLLASARRLSADHIRAHRGDEHLFWDPANLQTLCTSPCHNSAKQREERSW